MAYENNYNANYNYPKASNIFTGVIDESGNIYSTGYGRDRNLVGVDMQKYNELNAQITDMQSTLDEYFNRFGALEPLKTEAELKAEEDMRIMQQEREEQREINQAMLSAIQNLTAEISALKTSYEEVVTEEPMIYDVEEKTVVEPSKTTKRIKKTA